MLELLIFGYLLHRFNSNCFFQDFNWVNPPKSSLSKVLFYFVHLFICLSHILTSCVQDISAKVLLMSTHNISFYWKNINKIYESMHDKIYKKVCAPSEDSYQPGHPPSLISLCCLHEESLGPIECTAKTDQAGCMPRLIRVFAGRTCHFVGFVMLWLIYQDTP